MQQDLNRRRFLGAAAGAGATIAAGGALAPAAGAHKGRGRHGRWGGRHGRTNHVPRDRRGIQLYTLRDAMTNQAEATSVLNALGRMGYTEVETAGHYGWTAKQFRSVLRRAGLRAVSGHDGPDSNLANANWKDAYEETLEYAAELGQKFTGFAWFPGPYDTATFQGLADRFNEAGALAKEYGLQFFYHNHDFEFTSKQPNGSPNYDLLLAETDEDLVMFELDLYWITYANENPLAYLTEHADRFFAYHVKDRVWKDRPNADDFEDAGPGRIDFPDIFAVGDDGPDKHFFIEHDQPLLSHPDLGTPKAQLTTAKVGIEFLQTVTWR
jgi:sugar phosphate isomerase/epimerase